MTFNLSYSLEMVITRAFLKSLCRAAIYFCLAITFAFFFGQKAFAQAYGEGLYGGSGNNMLYGGGGGANNNDGNNEDGDEKDDEEDNKEDKDNRCNDRQPGENPPQITKAVVNKAAKTIALTFTSGAGPRDGFEIRYTTNPEDFSGVDHYDIDSGRNSYDRTIKILNTSANHYIKVRAVNGCAEGPYSKTETVILASSLKVGTTIYPYLPYPTESGSRMDNAAEQTGNEPQNGEEEEIETDLFSAAGTSTDNHNDNNVESAPELTNEDVSEGTEEQSFNWNPLENMLLLGIIGAIFFIGGGIFAIRRFIL